MIFSLVLFLQQSSIFFFNSLSRLESFFSLIDLLSVFLFQFPVIGLGDFSIVT